MCSSAVQNVCTGRLKMQDLDNAGPGKCLGSKMPDFVAKNQQIFVVELYNY